MLAENEGKVESPHSDLNLSPTCELTSFAAPPILLFFPDAPSISYFLRITDLEESIDLRI